MKSDMDQNYLSNRRMNLPVYQTPSVDSQLVHAILCMNSKPIMCFEHSKEVKNLMVIILCISLEGNVKLSSNG